MVSLHNVVVAEVKGGDAQVGAQVGVLAGVAVRQGRAELRGCLGELPVPDVHEPGQQPGVAARAVAGRRRDVAERCGLRGHVFRALADEGDERGGDHRHRPGAPGVDRSHVAGGLQQDPVADQGRADVPVHAGAQPVQVGAQQRIGGIRTGRVGQGAGAGRLRRVPRRLRGAAQPPGPDRRVGGELGCARPGRRGCLVAAAGGGPFGHGIKRAGHGIVRTVGGGGEVPGAPVGVADQSVGQGLVGGTALCAGGRAVDRRTHQRVVQRDHVAVDAQQAGLLDRVEGIVTGVEAVGGVPDHGQPGGVVGRGYQQESLRGLGQPPVPVQERPFDTAGERQLLRQRDPAGQLVSG